MKDKAQIVVIVGFVVGYAIAYLWVIANAPPF
jgi:hypothetical protein